jgi:hypothetical protein
MFPVIVLLMVGCGRGDDQSVIPPDEAPIAERQIPIQEPSIALEEQLVSGELRQVDPEAQTFTVMTADGEQVFTFSDVTAITGTAGAQGLAGQEGARVNVRYRDEQGVKMAVSIDLEMAGEPQPQGP